MLVSYKEHIIPGLSKDTAHEIIDWSRCLVALTSQFNQFPALLKSNKKY